MIRPLDHQDLRYVAHRAQRAFHALRNANIEITGTGGFIGSWLFDTGDAQQLAISGHRGRAAGDIREWKIGDDVSHVIHCASAASAAENTENPAKVADMITAGTFRVAAECERVGAKLLLISSGSVYDPHVESKGGFGETHPLRNGALHGRVYTSPADRIAVAKVNAEFHARAATDRLVIARGFAMLGPRLPAQFAAAEFVKAALDPRYIQVAGTGATVRSYLYAADVSAVLWHLLAFGKSGEAYNVGSDAPCTIGTLACHTAHAAGLDEGRAIRWGTANKDAAPFLPTTTKIRHLFSFHEQWIPLTPLESLTRWIAWERA